MLIYLGSYAGTGANLTVFTGSPAQQAKFVQVRRQATGSNAMFQTQEAQTDGLTSLSLPGTASGSITLNSDGSFTVSNNNATGAAANTYDYIAVYDNSQGDIFTAKYAGNASNPRSFTGYGFAPAVVFVKDGGNTAAAFRTLNHTASASSRFNANADTNTAITALGADGITVNSTMNAAATNYYVVAFKNAWYGNYTGDGSDNRDIATTGYPLWVTVKTTDATGSAVFRTNANADDVSGTYLAGAQAADILQRFGAAKFQVGTNLNVNASTKVYQWFALGAGAVNRVDGNLLESTLMRGLAS